MMAGFVWVFFVYLDIEPKILLAFYIKPRLNLEPLTLGKIDDEGVSQWPVLIRRSDKRQ